MLCHWLAVRASRMPWAEELRKLPPGRLRGILQKAGVEMSVTTHRKDLVAIALRATNLQARCSTEKQRCIDVVELRRLLDELLPESRRLVAKARDIGHMEECPEVVQRASSPPAPRA